MSISQFTKQEQYVDYCEDFRDSARDEAWQEFRWGVFEKYKQQSEHHIKYMLGNYYHDLDGVAEIKKSVRAIIKEAQQYTFTWEDDNECSCSLDYNFLESALEELHNEGFIRDIEDPLEKNS